MRVVLDTNVLISALLKPGNARKLLFTVADKNIQLLLSRDIVEEFLEVSTDQRLRKYVDENDIVAFLKVVGSISAIVKVRSKFRVVTGDPDDTVLRLACDGKAQYVVSGDRHLLSLGEFRGVKIVTISQMLETLEETEESTDPAPSNA